MIETLLRAFAAIQAAPDATELADALWLNTFMDEELVAANQSLPGPQPDDAVDPASHTLASTRVPEKASPSPWPEPQPADSTLPAPSALQAGDVVTDPVEQRLTAQGLRATPFYAAGATALPGALALARALRPLLRHVPAAAGLVLDEAATVEQMAAQPFNRHFWTPVMEPAAERWLDLALVVDQWGSMAIWQSTIDEFSQLLTQLGAFRNIYTYRLEVDKAPHPDPATAQPVLRAATGSQRLCRPKELLDPANRRLILLLSDCISPIWRNGSIKEVLTVWTNGAMVTLLQLLPAPLWPRTALKHAPAVDLSAPVPGLTNHRLTQVLPWYLVDDELPAAAPLPIITLEPKALSPWARLIAGLGQEAVPGVLITGEAMAVVEEAKLSAQERLATFQRSASPLTRELAGYLAAAPLTLPVMRLVQRTMLPHARQTHLAEFFLSGLIKRVGPANPDAHPNTIQYDFVDKALRNQLLATVGRSSSKRVLENVSAYISERNNQIRKFHALIVHPDSDSDIQIDRELLPFAQVAATVLKRLGSQYTKVVNQLETQLAHYERTIQLGLPAPMPAETTLPVFPSEHQYDRAIQNPENCFLDPQLKSATVTISSLGLPLVWHGNFACTFELLDQENNRWAVRCFHKCVPDRQIRYKAISNYLQEYKHPALPMLEYLENEILVEGKRYPITKMPWVSGETLGNYIDRNYKKRTVLLALAEKFRNLIDDLALLNIAHGDLTHDNIVIQDDGKLILVGYDSMWVPELANMSSVGLGHPHFQHPKRSIADFGPNLDRFSAIVIFLALQALMAKPDLWERFNPKAQDRSPVNGILFHWEDFQKPQASALLNELESVPQLHNLVMSFRKICISHLSDVPELRAFISNAKFITIEQVKPDNSATLPSKVLLREILAQQYDLSSDDSFFTRLKEKITQNWSDSMLAEKADWLRFTIGLNASNQLRIMYLRGNADGTHGLIAGDSGSGKSNLLITIIVDLALRYHPKIVNFLLVDSEDGTTFKAFGRMPHCADVITNVDKPAIGRMFRALVSEAHRRQRLNAETNTRDIIDYQMKGLHLTHSPYPHLFVIIDEYTRVISKYPELLDELEQFTRIGRAQGINLLLAAQDLAVISDQMLANMKYHICLQVKNADISHHLIGNANATFLPNIPGRGYLQIGKENPELIQIAHSGKLFEYQNRREDNGKPQFFDTMIELTNEVFEMSQEEYSPLKTETDQFIQIKNVNPDEERTTFLLAIKSWLIEHENELRNLLRSLSGNTVRSVSNFSFGVRGNIQNGVSIDDVTNINNFQFFWDSINDGEAGHISLSFYFECTVEIEALVYWTDSGFGPDDRPLNNDGSEPILYSVTGTPKVKVEGILSLTLSSPLSLDSSRITPSTINIDEITDIEVIEELLNYDLL